MKSLPLTVLAFAVLTGSVRGDAGPAFLKNLDTRGASVRFDNLKDYPAFDFYLEYQQRGDGAPRSHMVRVRSAEVIKVEGLWGEMYLLAVPHAQAAALLSKGISVSPSNTNSLRSEALEGTHSGAGYLVPYRVRIENDKLDVAMQSAEWLPGEWAVGWFKRLLCFAVPIAFCVALGWFGVRIAQRLFPAKPARPSV